MGKRIEAKPITIKGANEFVKEFHRHHRPTSRNSGKFAVSAVDTLNNEIVGVAIVGNPVSATLMDGVTLEITRLCIKDNSPKGTASFLMSRCSKIWKLMGGKKLITYTLCKESGASLKGAGWIKVAEVEPHNNWRNKSSMDGKSRDNLEIYSLKKIRWETVLS